MEYLQESGIKDIVVITGHLSEKVEAFCKKLGIKTLFNPFYEVSGMGLTLWVARNELEDDFILLYSDVLFDKSIIKNLMDNKGDICMAIKKDDLREEAEKVIEMDGEIMEVSKAQKENENGEFIGVAKFSRIGAQDLVSKLDQISRMNINASLIYVIDSLITEGKKIQACDIKNAKFLDIDFPEDLLKAENKF